MDFHEIRREYEDRGIQESQFGSCPLIHLSEWFQEAIDASPGRWFEVNAMSLATSDLEGHVSVRVVLLKGITDEGIRFFTNYDSAKGQQLAVNPRAAVVLHWPYLGRQIRVEGTTEKTTREVSGDYFQTRPRGSQLSAFVSRQSTVIESREMLDMARQDLDKEHEGDAIPLPDDWGGYLLRPNRIEFWQGRLDRLHDRIVFQKTDLGWQKIRIAP